jgi:ABC-type Fe3+ transport system substrate-binding protein
MQGLRRCSTVEYVTTEISPELRAAVERLFSGPARSNALRTVEALLDDPEARRWLAAEAANRAGVTGETIAEGVNRAAVERGEAPPGMVYHSTDIVSGLRLFYLAAA